MEKFLNQIEKELKLRNYSPKTISVYLGSLKEYFNFKNDNIEIMDEHNIKDFLIEKQNKGYSPQTINLYLNAIKFFYREVLKIPQKINLKFAKRTKKLPIVLSGEEIKNIIESIKNPKHKLIISLAYGAGLRVSEVVNLKIKDINLEGLTIHIKNAKGKKDRITIFPEKIKTNLQNLIAGKNLNDYLFESERGGKLTERTAQKVFENALKQCGIKKSHFSLIKTQLCNPFIGKWC